MPSVHFANQRGLQTSSEFLLDRGRSFLFGNTWFALSDPLSAFGRGIHLLPRSCISLARDFHSCSSPAVLAGVGSVPLAANPAVQPCVSSLLSECGHKVRLWQSMMSASSCVWKGSGFGARHVTDADARFGLALSSKTHADVCFGYKGLDNCRRISGRLNNRQPSGSNMVYKCFWSNVSGRGWRSSSSVDPALQDIQPSCSAPYSSGAAPDVSFDGAAQGEQLENVAASSEQNVLGTRSLKLLSGSCYMPHPDKEETGGEDAHFICVNEQAIGVADGVGGWADLGVDAGQYARELMSNSVSAIQEEPKGSVDPARVLEKAYLITKAKGSSTACIIALTEQGVHAVNLGDSGFIVVRDGCTIFRSPVQQHDFNFTYQLESGNGSDLPSAAQVFTFPVAPGDVIVAGTDGLFDNLYNNEVTAVVVHAVRAGLGPQVTAQKIAALARQRALDRNRQTPFSTAAQDAGYRYYGGKLDDITVVVSYITSSDA